MKLILSCIFQMKQKMDKKEFMIHIQSQLPIFEAVFVQNGTI